VIFVYRVTAGQEKVVADVLHNKIKKEKLPVYSIAFIDALKGYLIIEAEDEVAARQAAMRIPHIKGVLKKPMSIQDITTLIATKAGGVKLNKGDIVELISGPFKGERARVIKIDEAKEECTVELIEVAVPIPVTIKLNTVRVHQKAEDVTA
jgi:transcriptional antiterminator NusG